MESDKSNQNLINFAFVLAGAIAYYVVMVLVETLAGTFGVVARLRGQFLFQHGLPLAVGIGVFLYLVFTAKTRNWADECISEVRKVVWPSRKDTTAMTIVCCVMCIVAGIGFGVFDFFASQLIKVFVN